MSESLMSPVVENKNPNIVERLLQLQRREMKSSDIEAIQLTKKEFERIKGGLFDKNKNLKDFLVKSETNKNSIGDTYTKKRFATKFSDIYYEECAISKGEKETVITREIIRLGSEINDFFIKQNKLQENKISA